MKIKTIQFVIACLPFLFACGNGSNKTINNKAQDNQKVIIATILDSFNVAAANADYERYFAYYADDAIFIGTDATERWNKSEFMVWAKPFFDKKRTWNFSALQRNVYLSEDGNMAWFDELLSTQMKICRGSGVLIKQNQIWKIQQYVLSTTIPNNIIDTIVALKSPLETPLIQELQKSPSR